MTPERIRELTALAAIGNAVVGELLDALDASHAAHVRVVERLQKDLEAERAAHAATTRELERWKHGEQIEGDYVCPNLMSLTEEREAHAETRAERDAADALVVILRNVVSASLHGNAQEKANAYAALHRHDKRVREEALKKDDQ